MVDFVVMINGVPGAGKTTLAVPLARALDAPLVAKDAIKESLFDAAGGRAPRRRVGVLASGTQWALAALLEGDVVIESFFASGRDEPYVERGLAALGSPPGVEIWCEVPLETAFERYRTRPRHDAHEDAARYEEWRQLTRAAGPISGLPVLRVRTDEVVDLPGITRRIDDLRTTTS